MKQILTFALILCTVAASAQRIRIDKGLERADSAGYVPYTDIEGKQHYHLLKILAYDTLGLAPIDSVTSNEDTLFIHFPDTTMYGIIQGADNWGTQVVESDATLDGDGTSGSLLRIAQQGATTGQVLKWNGSTWVPDNDIGGTGGDDWGSQVAQTDATITGDGTIGAPLGTDTTNYIATLYDLTLINVDDADADPTNEFQVLDTAQLSGTDLELSLSDDGEPAKVIDLSPLQDGTGTDDQNLTWNGGTGELSIEDGNTVDLDGRYLQTEVDGSTTNELQDIDLQDNGIAVLKLTNSTPEVYIKPGTNVDLGIDAPNDTITINVPSLDDADPDPTNEIDHDWHEVGTSNPADAITDSIFTQGPAAVNWPSPERELHVYSDNGIVARFQADTSGANRFSQVEFTDEATAPGQVLIGSSSGAFEIIAEGLRRAYFADGDITFDDFPSTRNDVSSLANLDNVHFSIAGAGGQLGIAPFDSVAQKLVEDYPSLFGDTNWFTEDLFLSEDRAHDFGNHFMTLNDVQYFQVHRSSSGDLRVRGDSEGAGISFYGPSTDWRIGHGIFEVNPLSDLLIHPFSATGRLVFADNAFNPAFHFDQSDGSVRFYSHGSGIFADTDDTTIASFDLGGNVQEMDSTDLANFLGINKQYLDTAQLNGTDLQLSLYNDGIPTSIIDLSSLQDGTGTDDQTLTWNGGTGELSIEDGNIVDLDGRYLQSEVDGSTTNELNLIKEDGAGIQAFNSILDFQAGFDVATDGAGEVNIGLDLSEISVPLGISLGTEDQIPHMNAAGTDFDYTDNFRFTSSGLKLFSGSLANSELVIKGNGNNTDFFLEENATTNGWDFVANSDGSFRISRYNGSFNPMFMVEPDGDFGIGSTGPFANKFNVTGTTQLSHTTGEMLRLTASSGVGEVTLRANNGGGGFPMFSLIWENNDLGVYDAAKIESFNSGSVQDGDLRFYTTNGGVMALAMELKETGQFKLNQYPGSFTGTADKWLAIESDGDVIIVDPPSGSADGNGVLDSDNNGGTIPSSFGLNITDNFNLDGIIYIDQTNQEVGINTTGPAHYLHIAQTADTKDGLFIESTTTADEMATLNLRGRQDGTDGNSSRITFSNFDDDDASTQTFGWIETDRSSGSGTDGILTLSTIKSNGVTETEHIILDGATETTHINAITRARSESANTTVNLSSSDYLFKNTNTGAVTVNLPDAETYSSNKTIEFKIYCPSATGVTINGGSGDSVNDFVSNINQIIHIIKTDDNEWTAQN